jgi:hypothetical protein
LWISGEGPPPLGYTLNRTTTSTSASCNAACGVADFDVGGCAESTATFNSSLQIYFERNWGASATVLLVEQFTINENVHMIYHDGHSMRCEISQEIEGQSNLSDTATLGAMIHCLNS